MSKRDRINELEKELEVAHVSMERCRREALKFENEKHAKVALDKFAKRCRETTETLDLLKLGYVKVETLRGMILQDYEVGYNGSSATAEMRLRLRSGNRVEDALRAAILVKPKPKFATGGYVGNTNLLPAGVHPGYFLPGGYHHPNKPWFARAAADGGFQWDRTDATPLSEAELDAVRRSAKKSTEASFKLSWGDEA